MLRSDVVVLQLAGEVLIESVRPTMAWKAGLRFRRNSEVAPPQDDRRVTDSTAAIPRGTR